MKRALITGATGQDGSYLSELLLENGYEVHGLIRRVSMPTRQRLAAIINNPRFVAHYGDMTDAISIDVTAFVVPRNTYHAFHLDKGSVLLGAATELYDRRDERAGVVKILDDHPA